MVFEDRVAKYPGRWTMVKSDGTSEVVTLVRNDEPTVEGTPINAATLNELSTVAGAINAKEESISAAQAAASERAKAEQAAVNAAENEKKAKASETESAKNLQGTKEYFEQVRTITIGAQGWYATPEALATSVPVGENGWWAVVGTTDTIWTWDSDTGAWKDSIQKADLSDYYTHLQTDQKLSDLKAETDALLKAMQTNLQKQISAAAAITASGKGYIRFSDGTQICWNTAKLSYSRTYYFFAFPVPFIDTTYAVAGMKTAEISDTDSNGFYFNKKTTDRVELKSACNSYNENPYSTLIVIGRWK